MVLPNVVNEEKALTIVAGSQNRQIAQAVDRVKVLQAIVRELYDTALTPNLDYGVIPGTGDKPTLLLPGMEKLMRALNAVPEYIERTVIRDYDRPLFHYEYECRLIDADTGLSIPGGRGLGLCTSMESAFRWRKAERICPTCGKPAIIKGKAEYGGGWLCWQKREGCNAKFADGDKAIESQEVGRIENPDIFDQVNGIMKRGKKRALGDAIKGAANISEYFTVDLEDLPTHTFGDDVITVEATTVPEPWTETERGVFLKHWIEQGLDDGQMRAALGIRDFKEWQGTYTKAHEIVIDWAHKNIKPRMSNNTREGLPDTEGKAPAAIAVARRKVPAIRQSTLYLYPDAKSTHHHNKSINALIDDGVITNTSTPEQDEIALLERRALKDHEMSVNDIFNLLGEQGVIILEWGDWIASGKTLEAAWAVITDAHAQPAGEANDE